MTADPWRRLAAAVLLQAVKDATGKGFKATPGDVTGAQEWLCSIEGQDLAAALDMDNSLRRWLGQETSTKANNRQQIYRSEENVEEC